MSALQFLSKKSWHTSTIRNNEKVWLKEQEAAKEKARIAELQKQLEEERKLEEIQRLEIESGRLDPSEVLKRRRLNWMYEQGPSNNDAEGKEKEKEKERDDMLLGKKEIDLNKLAEQDEAEKCVAASHLVDVEAKMREDPLLLIEKQKAQVAESFSARRLGAAMTTSSSMKPPKYSSEELAAKLERKKQREAVREERRRRRGERASRKRGRHHEPPVRALSASGYDLQAEEDGELQRFSGKHTTDSDYQNYGAGESRQPSRYGLHVPVGGTNVAVTKEFIPRTRQNGDSRALSDVCGTEPRARPSSRHSLQRNADDRQARLQEMKESALRIEMERREALALHSRETRREADELNERSRKRHGDYDDRLESSYNPANTFARESIARGKSAADRIRQRRAWATNDSDAAY